MADEQITSIRFDRQDPVGGQLIEAYDVPTHITDDGRSSIAFAQRDAHLKLTGLIG